MSTKERIKNHIIAANTNHFHYDEIDGYWIKFQYVNGHYKAFNYDEEATEKLSNELGDECHVIHYDYSRHSDDITAYYLYHIIDEDKLKIFHLFLRSGKVYIKSFGQLNSRMGKKINTIVDFYIKEQGLRLKRLVNVLPIVYPTSWKGVFNDEREFEEGFDRTTQPSLQKR